MSEPEYLTTEMVAARFHVTPEALYMQRLRGQKPGALGIKTGRRILFRASDLTKWWDEELAASLARAE